MVCIAETTCPGLVAATANVAATTSGVTVLVDGGASVLTGTESVDGGVAAHGLMPRPVVRLSVGTADLAAASAVDAAATSAKGVVETLGASETLTEKWETPGGRRGRLNG